MSKFTPERIAELKALHSADISVLREALEEIERLQAELVGARLLFDAAIQIANLSTEIERLLKWEEPEHRKSFIHAATKAFEDVERLKKRVDEVEADRDNRVIDLHLDLDEALKHLRCLLLSADASWEDKDEGHDWHDTCEAARAFLEKHK